MYLERMSEPWLSFARKSMNFINDQRNLDFVFQSPIVREPCSISGFSLGDKTIQKFVGCLKDDRNAPLLFSFSFTQDTVIGYEALSRYALNEKNRFIYTMEITIESTYVPGWNYTVRYSPETWMKVHNIDIPDARGQIKSRAKGTGYAFMVVSVCRFLFF